VTGLAADQALAAQRCASCPKMCRASCPTLAVTGNERHQPWGHARVAVAALGSATGFADAGVVDSAYACAVCSACTPPCKVEGVETPDLAWAVRAAVHDAGATPAIGLQAVAEAGAGRVLVDTGPPRWHDHAATLDRLRGLATAGADLLLWPGCGALGRRPGAALAAARSLRRLGIAFQVPERHRCCGMPALTFGDASALDAMLEAAAAAIAASGAGSVAVQSPSCSTLLGVRAPRLGRPMPATVEPLAVVLARAAAQPQPRSRSRVAAAYHDPCHLARHQAVLDAPRAALAASGYMVVELPHRGDATRCSGQGGGLPLTHPSIAAGYLGRLVDDVDATTAEVVVTGCASCAAALSDALPDRAVLELAEAVAGGVEDEVR